MGRKNLHIVEYSAPEPRVPASEETRLELSPFRLEARTAPRRYPNISQPVSPHFPPIERIPVPVTPFPRMFRDDPEPACPPPRDHPHSGKGRLPRRDRDTLAL